MAKVRTRITEFTNETQCMELMEQYNAVLVLTGYGSKSLYKDLGPVYPEGKLFQEPDFVSFFETMDKTHGKGHWLVVYGGDPLNPKNPDVAWVNLRATLGDQWV